MTHPFDEIAEKCGDVIRFASHKGSAWSDNDQGQQIAGLCCFTLCDNTPQLFVTNIPDGSDFVVIMDEIRHHTHERCERCSLVLYMTAEQIREDVLLRIYFDLPGVCTEGCPTCKGEGLVPHGTDRNIYAECWTCGGSGKITIATRGRIAEDNAERTADLVYKEVSDTYMRSDFLPKTEVKDNA